MGLLQKLHEPVLAASLSICLLLRLTLNLHRYDIAQHLAGRYKLLAKLLFVVQLLVSLAIVVISTFYASWRCTEDGEDYESGWWIVSDSSAISTLGDIVFILTVGASFLISFDSYINAKARKS